MNQELFENLAKIKKLTDSVVPIEELVKLKGDTAVTVTLERGDVHIEKVVHELLTVLVAHFESDTVYPKHTHNEHEYLIPIVGHILVDSGKGMIRYDAFEVVHITPGQEHIVVSPDDSTVIAIVIPKSEDY